MNTKTYTVRARVDGLPDGPVWATTSTLVAAIRRQREAVDAGIRNVVIILDGRVVDESSEEFADAELAIVKAGRP